MRYIYLFEIQCFPGNSGSPVFFEVPTVRMNKVRNFYEPCLWLLTRMNDKVEIIGNNIIKNETFYFCSYMVRHFVYHLVML
jgi:hypothetical protein